MQCRQTSNSCNNRIELMVLLVKTWQPTYCLFAQQKSDIWAITFQNKNWSLWFGLWFLSFLKVYLLNIYARYTLYSNFGTWKGLMKCVIIIIIIIIINSNGTTCSSTSPQMDMCSYPSVRTAYLYLVPSSFSCSQTTTLFRTLGKWSALSTVS